MIIDENGTAVSLRNLRVNDWLLKRRKLRVPHHVMLQGESRLLSVIC